MLLGRWLYGMALVAAAVLLAVEHVRGQAEQPDAPAPLVLLGAIEGPIGPATVRHVEKLVETAAERRAEALVLRLATPGGLTDSTRKIISSLLGSPVPVIGWVAPPGAHAASAGTYILYATPVAAMAPGTNLGAATPVQMGGVPGTPGPGSPPADAPSDEDPDTDDGDETEPAPAPPLSGQDAMTHKITNDAVAFIRSLAEMHGRNADWAEKAVREAESLSAQAALEKDVIDFIAADIGSVIDQADGRTVLAGGVERELELSGAVVEAVEIGTITRLLGIIANPSLAFVLMLIGIYGIIGEVMNPGALVPGVVGAICLTLALYSLNQLPLSYAGLALMILGIAFMLAEAVTPTFGVLGFGGLVAFVIGSAMLIDTDVPAYQISWWLIGLMAAISAVFLILVIGVAWRAYRRVPAGAAEVPGEEAEVLDWSDGDGHVLTRGERWRATGPPALAPGQQVRVAAIDGLTLVVEPTAGGGVALGKREG